jgi:hypothetical protein
MAARLDELGEVVEALAAPAAIAEPLDRRSRAHAREGAAAGGMR